MVGLNQPAPPLERSRVVVPDRAQSCRQAANVVFFRLGFLQVHHVHDGGQFLRLVCFRFSHQPLVFKAEGILRQQLKHLEKRTHRDDGSFAMKSQLIAIVAAVLVVGCGESQQSAPQAEPVEPVAEAAQPEPPTAKAPDITIHDAAAEGNIEVVKQHLAAGTDVNTKGGYGWTPLHEAAIEGHKEIAELLIAKGADVNVKAKNIGVTPLDAAIEVNQTEIAALLRKHGGKTGEELKAEGK